MDKDFLIDKHADAAICIVILSIESVFLLYAFYYYIKGDFGSDGIKKFFRIYFYVLLVFHILVGLWIGFLIGKIVVKDEPFGWNLLDSADTAIKNYYYVVIPIQGVRIFQALVWWFHLCKNFNTVSVLRASEDEKKPLKGNNPSNANSSKISPSPSEKDLEKGKDDKKNQMT